MKRRYGAHPSRTPQQPDLYTRIHHRIVAAVLDVLPLDAVCSIDELAATVEPRDVPAALAHQIKQRLRDAVGDHITCSIGYAPNRWLAKIAADLDKPDGLTVLHPQDLPGRLLTLDLEDLPGVATRMRTRLARWGFTSVEDLWQADPLQLRAAWGTVTGARLWYALHGYAVAPPRGVGARMRAGLRASNRRARHLPMRYETGLPSSVIRFRT